MTVIPSRPDDRTPEQRAADRERFASVGFLGSKGQSRTRLVPHEDRPGIAGTVTDHWDGHQDACARPDTVHIRKPNQSPGG